MERSAWWSVFLTIPVSACMCFQDDLLHLLLADGLDAAGWRAISTAWVVLNTWLDTNPRIWS